MTPSAPRSTAPDVATLASGKVRDRYAVGGYLILLASDRVSAYDVILPTPIPDKGRVLTALSAWWFDHLSDLTTTHCVTTDVTAFPEATRDRWVEWAGRAMLAKALDMLPVECVVRGYLAGSGWREYQAAGTVCGIALPDGLREGDALPEPIFTPATKAEGGGHDENISFATMGELIGADQAAALRDRSLALYERMATTAASGGIILADTKFEFGVDEGGDLVLADEVGTPDSSRFWPAEEHRPGGAQPSFDKQYVRDWLDAVGWDHTSPAPELPDGVVAATQDRYYEAYRRLTGSSLPGVAAPGSGGVRTPSHS